MVEDSQLHDGIKCSVPKGQPFSLSTNYCSLYHSVFLYRILNQTGHRLDADCLDIFP